MVCFSLLLSVKAILFMHYGSWQTKNLTYSIIERKQNWIKVKTLLDTTNTSYDKKITSSQTDFESIEIMLMWSAC